MSTTPHRYAATASNTVSTSQQTHTVSQNKYAYDLLILGAGASGLMAAVTASAKGLRVALVEHSSEVGRKILIAGGGKCNFTNMNIAPEYYVGSNPHFTRSALARYTPWDCIGLLEEHGIAWEERDHGELFCRDSSEAIRSVLLQACRDNGCHFLLNTTIQRGEYSEDSQLFTVTTNNGVLFASCLLIATGSPAWTQIGATDIGLPLARSFGHSCIPMYPALVPFILPEDCALRGLQGISLTASITIKDQIITRDMLFTHRGISGPAVLTASCYWEKGKPISINFLPQKDIAACCEAPEHRKQLVRTMLARLLPARLAERLTPADIADRKAAELSRKDRLRLADSVHAYQITPEGTEGFRKAEAAGGGVNTKEVNPKTMESLIVKKLFFAGEVLDVTGHLGGFNLHWAWASGHAAGEGAIMAYRTQKRQLSS